MPLRKRLLVVCALLSALPVSSPQVQGGRPPRAGDVRVNQDASGNDQFESTVAVDPDDPLHLVAAWFENVPEPGVLMNYGFSFDGGLTWQSRRLDTGYQGNWDPSLAVDSLGNFYLTDLAELISPDGFFEDHFLIFKSTDGGETFFKVAELPVFYFEDKPWLTVDPATDAIYLVWADFFTSFDAFDILFAKSTDRGATFSFPIQISGPRTNGNEAFPSVGPGGEIYITWTDTDRRIFFDRSLDGGETWLPDDTIVDGVVSGWLDVLNGSVVAPLIPINTVDRTNGPHRGRIYVVWMDKRLGNDPDIFLSYSDDRGDAWSQPTRVNDDTARNGADQFLPWVVVDDSGAVQVTYLDTREDPSNTHYALYLATSTDGGLTFGPNVRVSDGSHPASA